MEERELKRLIGEILGLVLLLLIIIPICANASSEYNERKETMLNVAKSSVDISNKGDIKEVTVITNRNQTAKINLLLKISNFSDEYVIFLDDKQYELKNIEYTEAEEYRYYNLGIYEVNDHRVFKFKIQPKDKVYYDETLTYSFITEGVL